MTMEKQPFEDVLPIIHGDFPWLCKVYWWVNGQTS